MKERDVFCELLEGMTAWREFNAGNETLRSHSSCLKPVILTTRRAKRPRACGAGKTGPR
jgi:putative transcriptional regulator